MKRACALMVRTVEHGLDAATEGRTFDELGEQFKDLKALEDAIGMAVALMIEVAADQARNDPAIARRLIAKAAERVVREQAEAQGRRGGLSLC
jgi:hypothetical protein